MEKAKKCIKGGNLMHSKEKSLNFTAYLIMGFLLGLNLVLAWAIHSRHFFHEVGDILFLWVCALPLGLYAGLLYPKKTLLLKSKLTFKKGLVLALYLVTLIYLILVLLSFLYFLVTIFGTI